MRNSNRAYQCPLEYREATIFHIRFVEVTQGFRIANLSLGHVYITVDQQLCACFALLRR